jgi:hypothetical protein
MKPYLLKGRSPLPKPPEPDPVRVGLASVEGGVGDIKDRLSVIPGGISEVLAILRGMEEKERQEAEEELVEKAKEKEEEARHEAEEAKAIADQFAELRESMAAERAKFQGEINDLKAMAAENVDVMKMLLSAVEGRIAGMLGQHKPRDDKKILDSITTLEATVSKLLMAPKMEFDLTPVRGADGRITNVKAVQK